MSEKNPTIQSINGVGLPRLILELATAIASEAGGSVFTSTTARAYRGRAIDLDGATERVGAGSTNLDFGAAVDMSVLGWIKPDSIGAGTLGVAGNTTIVAVPAAGWIIYRDADTVKCRISDGANVATAAGPAAALTAGAWSSFSVSCDRNGNMIVYVNGVAGTPVAVSTVGTITSASELIIGAQSDAGNKFAGDVGEFQVVRALAISAANALSHNTGGIPDGWSGGDVVRAYRWRGTTDAEMMDDRSRSATDGVGVGVAIADQVVGTYLTADRLSLLASVGMRVSSYAVGTLSKPSYGKVTSVDTTTDIITVADGWNLGTPTDGQTLSLDGWIADLPRTQEMTETFEPDHLMHELYGGDSGNIVETEFRGWKYTCVLDYSKFLSTDAIFDMRFHIGQKSNDKLILIPRRDAPQFQHQVYVASPVNVSKFPRSAGMRKVVFVFKRTTNLPSWPLFAAGWGGPWATSWGLID